MLFDDRSDAGRSSPSACARVLSPDVIDELGISQSQIEAVAVREQAELERRERAYRGARPAAPLHGRTVLLVDDGLATGATMRATCSRAPSGKSAAPNWGRRPPKEECDDPQAR